VYQATSPEFAEIQVELSDVPNDKVLGCLIHLFKVKFVVEFCDLFGKLQESNHHHTVHNGCWSFMFLILEGQRLHQQYLDHFTEQLDLLVYIF